MTRWRSVATQNLPVVAGPEGTWDIVSVTRAMTCSVRHVSDSQGSIASTYSSEPHI